MAGIDRTISTTPDDIMSKEELANAMKSGDVKFECKVGDTLVFNDGPEHEAFKAKISEDLTPPTDANLKSSRDIFEHAGVGSFKPGENQCKPIEKMNTQDITQAEDPVKCGMLNYAVVSFICPPKCNKMAMKISGCFETEEQASEHAQRLMDKLPYFDISVVSMYRWLAFPLEDDDKLKIPQKFKDNELQKIMDRFREDQIRIRADMKKRIAETKEKAEGKKATTGDTSEDEEDPVEKIEIRGYDPSKDTHF